jgi:hypothetical protein
MNRKLSLDSLNVETFATAVTDTAVAFAGKTRNYTDCGSCGIACTYVDCV